MMLRLDPGDGRIHTTRTFQAWEGGGEYNVARGLRRCFGLRTRIVTALADNPVGRLVQDLIYQGGVDQSYVRWMQYDGVGRSVRNGLNFTERGFGVRAAARLLGPRPHGRLADEARRHRLGRASSAGRARAGSTPAASSARCRRPRRRSRAEAMEAAQRHGTWCRTTSTTATRSGRASAARQQAREVNRALVPFVDVHARQRGGLHGGARLRGGGRRRALSALDPANFRAMIERAVTEFPNFKVVATTLRNARRRRATTGAPSAGARAQFYEAPQRRTWRSSTASAAAIRSPRASSTACSRARTRSGRVECGAAHGALAMTTPGDTTMATLAEVEKVMKGGGARVAR